MNLGSSAVLEWTSILGLVFGGCCWNVFALEAVLKEIPKAGIFLTFAQFTYVTLQTAWSQLEFAHQGPDGTLVKTWRPKLRSRRVPLQRWMVQVVLFLGVSLMNNFAFSLKVPVPVHIIFRSGGLCVSMAVGYLYGKKKYTGLQVSSVFLVTVGILLATLSAPPKPKPPITPQAARPPASTPGWPDELQYAAGIALLGGALLVSAVMGLWQEGTYRRYGAVWQEGLFYSHALSLPFFLPFQRFLTAGVSAMSASPGVRIPLSFTGLLAPIKYPMSAPGSQVQAGWAIEVPRAWIALGVNVVTQGLCVRGVNRLTARVSAVTVNLILTVRKAVSLLISVMHYGSGYNIGLAVGAGMVLLGTMLYSTSAAVPGASKADDRSRNGSTKEVSGVSTSVVSSEATLRRRT